MNVAVARTTSGAVVLLGEARVGLGEDFATIDADRTRAQQQP